MRRSRVLVFVLLSSCAGDPEGTPTGPTGPTAPPITDVEFGLETRPDNPDCVARPRPAPVAGLEIESVFPNLYAAPLIHAVQQRLDPNAPATARWFLVGKEGIVWTPNAAGNALIEVLTIDGPVADCSECGLLGFAFDPDYSATGAGNHDVYVNYTGGDPTGTWECPVNEDGTRLCTFIARYELTSADGGLTFTQGPEEILMRIQQPWDNHNGGHILFGPDNYLYIGMGDGGSGNDPSCAGQDPNTPLGKMLRIDVRGGAVPYGIPATNPYVSITNLCDDHLYTFEDSPGDDRDISRAEACPEIFAMGLRNPWRFSFDRLTDQLWVGDVGQQEREEMSLVELGGNYGWDHREGTRIVESWGRCDSNGAGNTFIDPVVEYDHGMGSAITGGYVYRGGALSGRGGQLFFTDSGSGRLWAIADPYNQPSALLNPAEVLSLGPGYVSFAEDENGELYVIPLWGGQGDALGRIVATGQTVSDFPAVLSETGCVDPDDPRTPSTGLIPYGLTAPFWSDGAEKSRYLGLPNGLNITLENDGDFAFPVGTVLMKEFRLGGRLIETRLLMRHSDGDWAGYSYAWNNGESEAFLLDGSESRDWAGQTWTYPSRGDCLTCHTAAAGGTLGPELAQLGGTFIYPGNLRAPQLDTWTHLDLFSTTPMAVTPLVDPFDPSASLEARARSYLHSNCANCHRPGGSIVDMDLRATTALADSNTCDVSPTQGTWPADARRLVAGNPATSLLHTRINSAEPGIRMPPLGKNVVDEPGAALIAEWISSLTTCP